MGPRLHPLYGKTRKKHFERTWRIWCRAKVESWEKRCGSCIWACQTGPWFERQCWLDFASTPQNLCGIEIVALTSGGAAGIYYIIFKCAHAHIQTLKCNLLYCKYQHTWSTPWVCLVVCFWMCVYLLLMYTNMHNMFTFKILLAEMCEELSVGDMIQSVDSTPLDNIADNQVCPQKNILLITTPTYSPPALTILLTATICIAATSFSCRILFWFTATFPLDFRHDARKPWFCPNTHSWETAKDIVSAGS